MMHSPRPQAKRLLVTGADGYIGAVLTPRLLAAGYQVTGLDSGFYRRGWLFDDRAARPLTVSRDVRDVTVDDLTGFDAVVLRADQDRAAAERALGFFAARGHYQGDVKATKPVFGRAA